MIAADPFVVLAQKANRVVIWRGLSPVTGAGIAVVLQLKPSNRKIGDMVQAYIVATDVDPVTDRRANQKASTCGTCPLAQRARCYVRAEQAPLAMHKFAAGLSSVPTVDLSGIAYSARWRRVVGSFAAGRACRLGADGDPAMVPTKVWRAVLAHASTWTGYTHQTRYGASALQVAPFVAPGARLASLRGLVMASVQTVAGARAAWAGGWRTFRVRVKGAPVLPGEIDCPSVTHGTSCADCGLCKGAAIDAPSITIEAHGGAVTNRESNKFISEEATR
jgi:hypothetical protein